MQMKETDSASPSRHFMLPFSGVEMVELVLPNDSVLIPVVEANDTLENGRQQQQPFYDVHLKHISKCLLHAFVSSFVPRPVMKAYIIVVLTFKT
jgi:hypothetical protein